MHYFLHSLVWGCKFWTKYNFLVECSIFSSYLLFDCVNSNFYFHPLFGGSSYVYIGAISLTSIIALYDGLRAFGFTFGIIDTYRGYLPFSELGLGWIVPAFIGSAICYI
ncbi:branched-chain amino acid transport system II carrier protein [Psychrobacillus lasiicapitis]|uniref:branched-chain amino acid transport system II carrier protein n=1 Tax=Psychrobacillus lasiicapitis TaxID=1636719 RepID=UPI0014777C60